jgi:hypothetical protein
VNLDPQIGREMRTRATRKWKRHKLVKLGLDRSDKA